jgi:hypothetical protein
MTTHENSSTMSFFKSCEVGGPAAWRREVGGLAVWRREIGGPAAWRPKKLMLKLKKKCYFNNKMAFDEVLKIIIVI